MSAASAGLLNRKGADARRVIAEAFDRYETEQLAVAWTGGKDSTLVLFLVCQVCEERGLKLPQTFCIDEGDVFEEIRSLTPRLTSMSLATDSGVIRTKADATRKPMTVRTSSPPAT